MAGAELPVAHICQVWLIRGTTGRIFEQIDSRLIEGTAIYIGYGTSDAEMLAQGRFRVLQVL
jgi:hypothetical protein